MATGVGGWSETNFTFTVKFDNPEKPPHRCKNQEHTSRRSSVIANFLLKVSNFRYHGNTGWSKTNFTYTVKFAAIEKPRLVKESGTYLP